MKRLAILVLVAFSFAAGIASAAQGEKLKPAPLSQDTDYNPA